MSYKKKVRLHAKKRSFSLLLPLLVTSLMAQSNKSMDATTIPLEELVETKYIPASHIANQISNATSAVSIVTAQDIKDYGYRTLGDILSSMRGLSVSHDYEYSFLAGRGFSSPGEYAGRIIVLIDGYRADDSFYGQAYLGNDGILDVALIERVEYIPGGGSSGYSNGALLGAINIITKKGSDFDGTQVALGYGSYKSHQQRATVGERFENGADFLLSVSTFSTHGRDFSYNDSILGTIEQKGDNAEDNKRLLFKASYENFSLMAAYVKRNLNIPSYPSTAIDGDPLHGTDKNQFVRLKYDVDLSKNTKLSSSIWAGAYIYKTFDPTSWISYGDTYNGGINARWNGGDVKLIGTWFDNHVLSLGTEYRHDYEWSWYDYYTNTTTNEIEYPSSGEVNPRKTYSLYVYDDFSLTRTLSFNYGARYENSDNDTHALSPHAAVIWKPLNTTVLKLSAGKSNRQATPQDGANTNKVYTNPEKSRALEFVLEQKLGYETKLLGSLYRYHISDRIGSTILPDIITRGAEIELEKHWNDGTRVRTSFTWQNAEEKDTGLTLVNAPSHIAKFNLSTPVLNEQVRMGLEMQYLGSRPLYTATRDEYAPGYVLTNINLLAHHIAPNLDVNFLVHNVFDKNYGDVIVPQFDNQMLLKQSGRTFWLQLEYTFK
ncbi:TonB-dependent receptor plug domain-containing protein [Sulfurospirillum oryzae]|uniref:TonB-dependent receptor plug domain-containing protein n=1 Tax=Sulfurospirillum oryzae TaxID=2976535 RepID=UPI0021E7382D|nr:TonB-dependent receptor [Sulfurospirillum oryzae]